MRRVMAQGTFDIIHPGHIHYLERSADLGEELVVVVARDERVRERKDLVFNEEERREILDALEVVDETVLGSEKDIYSTVESVDPDVITLGYDQEHDKVEIETMAEGVLDHPVEVVRIDGREDYSSSDIRS